LIKTLTPPISVGKGIPDAFSVTVARFYPKPATIDSDARLLFETKLAADTLVMKAGAMARVNERSPVHPFPSVERIVKLVVPTNVGIPVRFPLVASDNPGGT
jgi:hypothetical protein